MVMTEQNDKIAHFMAISSFESIYCTTHDKQVLVWEMRTKYQWNRELFTRINGRDVRVQSLQAFILSEPDSVSLTIPHRVNVLWNSKPEVAELLEIYSPMKGPHHPLMPKVWMNLKLTVGNMSYETKECDSFTEAIWELSELIGSEITWLLQTCDHCNFSYSAFPGPTSDRDDLRCFRDEPEAFIQMQEKGKFASSEALNSGDYFVNVFHTCAAWHPKRSLVKVWPLP